MGRSLTALLMLASIMLPAVYAQEDYVPRSMNITLYSAGTARVEYIVESDPNMVRTRVQLPGPPFINLIIRDENGYPLWSTASGPDVTVDSIGAQRLYINYLTESLTRQEGPIWSVNVTSPVETRVVLPEGAGLFDMSEVPLEIGVQGNSQYMDFSPDKIWVYYIIGMRQIEVEAMDIINKTGAYILEKEEKGYVLSESTALLEEAQILFNRGEFLRSKNDANDALEVAKITVERADSAADAFEKASEAVDQARAEDRLLGLETAEASLESAEDLMGSGAYLEAEAEASRAYREAVSASKPIDASMLIYGVFSIIAIAISALYYIFRAKITIF
jgi:hypothetical protein